CRLSANSIKEVSLIGSHLPNKSKRPLPTELIVNVHELFPNRLREERQTLILEHGLRDLTRLEAIEPASCVILLRMVGPGSIHVTSVSVWSHELLGGAPRDLSNPKPCSHNSCYCPTGWPCTYWLALHDRLIDHITIRYVRLTHSHGAFSQCLLESFTSKYGLHSTNNILTADSSIEHPDILSEVSIQQCWPESHCSSIHRAHASIDILVNYPRISFDAETLHKPPHEVSTHRHAVIGEASHNCQVLTKNLDQWLRQNSSRIIQACKFRLDPLTLLRCEIPNPHRRHPMPAMPVAN